MSMWKASDQSPLDPPAPTGGDAGEAPDAPHGPARAAGTRKAATLGPSIFIHGDVTGDEDLIVQGRVDGTIALPQNNLTVGRDARVKATVRARAIEIQGEIEGDMRGDEQLVIRTTGRARGNITAPRVTLEDGCRFQGSVDMETAPAPAGPGERPDAGARNPAPAGVNPAPPARGAAPAGTKGEAGSGNGGKERKNPS